MKLTPLCLLLLGLATAVSVHAQTPGVAPATPATTNVVAPTSATEATPATPAASPPVTPATAVPASPPEAAKDQAAAASPPSSPAVAAGSLPAPPPGKGQVVFFRSSAFTGMAVWFNVRENGTALGKLTNGTYFVQVTDPGPHTYTAATENRNTLHLEVDDGETYYVRGTVQMGFLVGEANMAPSDQSTFEKALKHMHLAKPPATTAPTDAANTVGK